MIVIRQARSEDADTIGRIYVEGWRSAYPGLLPDDMLAGMRDGPWRRRGWMRAIAASGPGAEQVLVAELDDGDGPRVVGFASGGPARSGALDHQGEVYTLYVEDDFQGLGIGRRLFATLGVSLAGRHGPSLIVWVLAGNPARFFYEALDGRQVGRRAGTMGGAGIEEVAFGWPNAAVLAARQD